MQPITALKTAIINHDNSEVRYIANSYQDEITMENPCQIRNCIYLANMCFNAHAIQLLKDKIINNYSKRRIAYFFTNKRRRG